MGAILVTGGAGFLGSAVVAALARHLDSADPGTADPDPADPGTADPGTAAAGAGSSPDAVPIVVGDLREPAALPSSAVFARCDVTDADSLAPLMRAHHVDVVVHLAAIVNPGGDEAAEYRVDVTGTANVLAACVETGVRRIVISSSGAAYGYHADNPPWITEDAPLRGNEEFSYARHKRLVEEMLARYRADHPELHQTIFRIGTILGPAVANQITRLWDSRVLLRIAGSASPFVFAWIDDVAEVFARAARGTLGPGHVIDGVFNVAGDGTMTVAEIAARIGKRTLTLPAWLLAAALAIGHALRLTPHGANHLPFLRYRPVLDNTRLKSGFGYVPRHTSAEAFDAYVAAHPGLARR